MKINCRNHLLIVPLILLISVYNSVAQITIDGDFSESQYNVFAIRVNNNPGWGNGSELTTIYIARDDSSIYLGIEGSVQRTPQTVNKLGDGIGLFLNFETVIGVEAGTYLGFEGDSLLHFLTGKDISGVSPPPMNYTADFEVDYSLAFFSDSLGNGLSLSAGTHLLGDTANPQIIATVDTTGLLISGPLMSGVFSANSITFAYQNYLGTGSKKGIEIEIPYSEFSGNQTTEIQLFAFVISSTAYFSDISIPGSIKNGSPGFEPDFYSNIKSPNCVCGSTGSIGSGTYHTFDLEEIQTINYQNFRNVEGLTITRAAARVDSILRLTPAEYAVYGSTWFHQKQFVEAGFETSFKFKIYEGNGADGLAFVIQNEGPDTIGTGGGSIGYGDLTNSIAIEFDTYTSPWDPPGHHIAIHVAGNPAISFAYYNANGNLNLRDQLHEVYIKYIPGNLVIFLDSVQVLQAPIFITDYMDLDNGKSWVGFVASTGGSWDAHELSNWNFSGTNSLTPQIYSISPTNGGNTGFVTMRIYGSNFDENASVRLSNGLIGENTIVDSSGQIIVSTFDLNGSSIGTMDVIVENPDTTISLMQSFTIEEGTEPNIWVDIIGRDVFIPGRPQTWIIVYGNSGNTDAYGIPLWISFPANIEWDLLTEIFIPDSIIFSDSLDLAIEIEDTIYLPMIIPIIPANSQANVRIRMKSQLSTNSKIRVWVTKPNVESFMITNQFHLEPNKSDNFFEENGDCWISLGQAALNALLPNECIDQLLVAYSGFVSSQILKEKITNISLSKNMLQLIEVLALCAPELIPQYKIPETALKIIKILSLTSNAAEIGYACRNVLSPIDIDDFVAEPVGSFDPNDKIGAFGNSPQHYISGYEPMRYTIMFENLNTATAPAQEVFIKDSLDVSKFDLNTFSLGSISFGENYIVTPPPGLKTFTTDVDLRPAKNTIVRIGADLNEMNGVVTWSFISLDPATMLLTEDPFGGFLPPNVNPPEGEGGVFFTVNTKEELGTGSIINNKAQIVFDLNAPIETPVWSNTIDKDIPVSHVNSLSASYSDSCLVNWTGSDVGSGIADYSIYVSFDGNPFVLWTNTPDTSKYFVAEFNGTYSFYSIAKDAAGNREPDKTLKEAICYISNSSGISISVGTGWNMVSFPAIHPNSMIPDTLFRFRNFSANVFSFGTSGYTSEDTLKNKVGYWLKHSGQHTYFWDGTIQEGILYPNLITAEVDTISGNSGWNLIGVYDYEVATNQIYTIPYDIIQGYPYGYNPGSGYYVAQVFEPGQGYFIKLSESGQIVYPERQPIPKMEFEEIIKGEWAQIRITDAIGKKYTLYSTSDNGQLDKFLLPPKPPVGSFDVRFSSDRFIEDLSSEKIIDITGMEFPIKIKVSKTDIMIRDAINGEMLNRVISNGDEIVIENNALTKFVVSSNGIAPAQYELSQNYPNPFNPSTTIKYQIAKDGFVTLKVYDILGNEVSVLVNEEKKQGRYDVNFDASSFASGVYFYSMRVNNFVQVKKMILLK